MRELLLWMSLTSAVTAILALATQAEAKYAGMGTLGAVLFTALYWLTEGVVALRKRCHQHRRRRRV